MEEPPEMQKTNVLQVVDFCYFEIKNNHLQGLNGKSLVWFSITGSTVNEVLLKNSSMKGLYGGGFYSRKMSSQRVEGHLKCLMMNQMIRQPG